MVVGHKTSWHDSTTQIPLPYGRFNWVWYPLVDALMRACAIVECNILCQHPAQVPLVHNEDAVKTLLIHIDRDTHCIVNGAVEPDRSEALLQQMVDNSPQPDIFFSDAFPPYALVDTYSAQHWMWPDKSRTYSVEGDKAELRHYLARLARRSRCFHTLRATLRIFVFCWNQRQLYKQRHPTYSSRLIDFVPMLA